jgi:hypothetical protein
MDTSLMENYFILDAGSGDPLPPAIPAIGGHGASKQGIAADWGNSSGLRYSVFSFGG